MNGPHRTPQVDIYTALLAIALVAVILGTIFAYLETSDYGDNKYKGAPNVPAVVQVDRGGAFGRQESLLAVPGPDASGGLGVSQAGVQELLLSSETVILSAAKDLA